MGSCPLKFKLPTHLVSHVLCALLGPASESHDLQKSSVFEGNERDLCRGFILKLLDDMMQCTRYRAAQLCSHHFFDKMSFDPCIHVL